MKKKIDLILTKSISRFGRNTLDMLRTLRVLNHCGTEAYFEQENIRLSSQHIQVLLTAYCTLAQAESEDMSHNIKWGIKRGFQNGSSWPKRIPYSAPKPAGKNIEKVGENWTPRGLRLFATALWVFACKQLDAYLSENI